MVKEVTIMSDKLAKTIQIIILFLIVSVIIILGATGLTAVVNWIKEYEFLCTPIS